MAKLGKRTVAIRKNVDPTKTYKVADAVKIVKGNAKAKFDETIEIGECKHGGNTLDFIARMESVSIHAAALKAIDWFSLDPDAMSASSEESNGRPSTPKKHEDHPAKPPRSDTQSQPAVRPASTPESGTPNKPLQFRLDKLVHEHP